MIKYSIIMTHFNRPILIQKNNRIFFELKDKEIIVIDDDFATKKFIDFLRLNWFNFFVLYQYLYFL